jgi:hypothetical protein
MNTATVTLYTDERAYEITKYTTAIDLQEMITAPYHQAQITLQIPLHEQSEALPYYEDTGAIDLDSWLVVSEWIEREGVERAIFLGRLNAVSYGIEALSDPDLAGLVASPEINITAGSFIAPLTESQVYLSGKPLLSGHIYELKSFGRLLKRVLSRVLSSDVGSVLRALYNEFAPHYRLPETLAGGAQLSALPVIHSQARAQQYAPERAPLFRSVFGRAINAAQVRPTGAPWSILSSFFDVDPSLIELYPSLEPASVSGEVSDFLGCTPVIIYRLKPFIFEALSSQGVDPNAPAQQEHAARLARIITADEIIRLGVSANAQDRVNSVYVDTPFNESRGVEAFGLVGTPTLDREDIERAGLRMYRGQWPFFPQGRASKAGSLNREVQYTIEIVDRLTRGAHRYLQGTANTAQRLDIRAGQWVKFETPAHDETRYFCAYVETISHSTRALSGGVITRRSTLSLTRGFYTTGEPAHD